MWSPAFAVPLLLIDCDQKENTALDNDTVGTYRQPAAYRLQRECRLRSTSRHTLKENCPPPSGEHYRSLERTDNYSAGEFCARNLSGVKKLRRLFTPKCKKGANFSTAGN